jgi:hypothetical protein
MHIRPFTRYGVAIAALLLAGIVPAPVASQIGVVVEGRVFDSVTGSAIQNALVEMEGQGATLTSAEGTFRLAGVALGSHALRVVGFGYAPHTRLLAVAGDVTISVGLEAEPLRLDSLVVEPRLIDIEGRVRDPTRDLNLVDAEILSSQAVPVFTGAHGRFELEDVVAEVPLRLVVNAFGYFPIDTILLPQEDESYRFELEPDPMVERMVEVQVGRLEERASPLNAMTMRPMNREQLLSHAGRRTLADVLQWEYPGDWLRRVNCVVINEVQLLGAWQPSTLYHILPEDVERIEFLFDGAMLRIYTREFMREMISRDVALRMPSYIYPFPRPAVDPLCR